MLWLDDPSSLHRTRPPAPLNANLHGRSVCAWSWQTVVFHSHADPRAGCHSHNASRASRGRNIISIAKRSIRWKWCVPVFRMVQSALLKYNNHNMRVRTSLDSTCFSSGLPGFVSLLLQRDRSQAHFSHNGSGNVIRRQTQGTEVGCKNKALAHSSLYGKSMLLYLINLYLPKMRNFET